MGTAIEADRLCCRISRIHAVFKRWREWRHVRDTGQRLEDNNEEKRPDSNSSISHVDEQLLVNHASTVADASTHLADSVSTAAQQDAGRLLEALNSDPAVLRANTHMAGSVSSFLETLDSDPYGRTSLLDFAQSEPEMEVSPPKAKDVTQIPLDDDLSDNHSTPSAGSSMWNTEASRLSGVALFM